MADDSTNHAHWSHKKLVREYKILKDSLVEGLSKLRLELDKSAPEIPSSIEWLGNEELETRLEKAEGERDAALAACQTCDGQVILNTPPELAKLTKEIAGLMDCPEREVELGLLTEAVQLWRRAGSTGMQARVKSGLNWSGWGSKRYRV